MRFGRARDLTFALSAAFAIAANTSGCSSKSEASNAAPARSCELTIWTKPASTTTNVEVVTSWENWQRPGRILSADRSDGWRVTSYDPPPGEQQYAIVQDGVWTTDPNIGTTSFISGTPPGTADTEVTWVDVADCSSPALQITDANGSNDGTATAHATFLTSSSGAILDPATVNVTDENGKILPQMSLSARQLQGAITLNFRGLVKGKHRLTLAAKDMNGKEAAPAVITVWIEQTPFDFRDAVIYEIMVDRYRGNSGATALALPDPTTPASRAGGTIAGIMDSLDAIQANGFNTIWMTPLYSNPDGTYIGSDGRQYSSYHGYWPIDPRRIESLFGSEADVDALIAAAHSRSMRVLFDVVPNHVHQDSPYAKAHLNDGWFNNPNGQCICGTTCDWATHIEDCWFAPYLPDLDWRNSQVAEQISSDVLWWMDRFDADGIRIDAVPMMPRAANRRIAEKIRSKYDHPGNETFLLGENYVDQSGYDLLRYDLGPAGLSSEFHFPLMWALRDVVAQEDAGMTEIQAAIETGEQAWNGSGAIMSLIIGNHDVSRFSTVSNADDQGDTWTQAVQSTELLVYEKQRFAMSVIYTLPGAPTVYYGDEVGLAGRADPDSRRVMPDDSVLTANQKATRDFTSKLARARSCSEALRRGTYRTLYADTENLVFQRTAEDGDTAIVTFSRAPLHATLGVPLPGISAGSYIDMLDGSAASLTPELTNLATAPFSAHLYVPAGSACAKGF
ncbi:MAG: alpha-amylase family glycosyl hydrolase [Polyangiaceae bacterium]